MDSFIWTCPIPSISYSTGSSAVKIFIPGLLMCFKTLYKVVVLPLPVGPVTNTIPWGELTALINFFKSFSSKPRSLKALSPASLFKIRITTRSLFLVGKSETLKSISFVSDLNVEAPSWGTLLSAISSLLIILTLAITAS